jgi:hypothetical protein
VGDAEGVPDLVPGVEEAVGVIDAVPDPVGVMEAVPVPVGVIEGVALGVADGLMAILRSFPVPLSPTYMTPLGVSKYNP